ncbi:MAG: potassium channel family protein [Pyrinomonadaceae bacterium]
MSNHSKKYRITKLLSQIPIIPYFFLVVGLYLISILIFALIYFKIDSLYFSADSSKACGFALALYFSAITQTTTGYGDIVPKDSARIAAAIQALYGTIYVAIFVGLYLLRYIWTVEVVRVSEVIAFDPQERVFRVRILNLSAFDLHNLSLGLWVNADKEDATYYLSNKPLPLVYNDLLSISSMSPWRIKTLPIEVTRIKEIFKLLRKFYFQIDGKFVFSNYVNTVKITKDHLLCGNFAALKEKKHSTKDYKRYRWENFDRVVPIQREEDECAPCEFSSFCICKNRAFSLRQQNS